MIGELEVGVMMYVMPEKVGAERIGGWDFKDRR